MEPDDRRSQAVVSDLGAFRRRKASVGLRGHGVVLDESRTGTGSSSGRASRTDVGSSPFRGLDRRPRREVRADYALRIEILDAARPLYRDLLVASDLPLSLLHQAIQASFGWEDGQPHAFTVGEDAADRTVQPIMPADAPERLRVEHSVDEADVTLDEILTDPGDRFFYEYDFGDSWRHLIRLERVGERTTDAAPVVCTGGARLGPAEESGGIGYYEWMLLASTDPQRRDHRQALDAMRLAEREPGRDDVDLADVGRALRLVGRTPLLRPGIADSLEALYARLGHSGRLSVAGALVRADLHGADVTRVPEDELAALTLSTSVDALLAGIGDADVAIMTEPWAWFVRRVGEDGVALTPSGHLPPEVVDDAIAAFSLDRSKLGRRLREDRAFPVLPFREVARSLGLVRTYRGRLELTRAARAVIDSPRGLLGLLARRVASVGSGFSADVGALTLLAVASDEASAVSAVARRVRLGSRAAAATEFSLPRLIAQAGWRGGRRTPVTDEQFRDAGYVVATTIRIVATGRLTPGAGTTGPGVSGPGVPGPDADDVRRARAFARLALHR